MKKIYTYKKEVIFNNNIYDILSIAIDKKFSLDGYAIKGKFRINGQYLINENEKDDFDYTLDYLNYIEDNYDISKIKVDIDDFYYEIKDSSKLVINIDIVVDGLEEKERCIDATIEEGDEYNIETDNNVVKDFIDNIDIDNSDSDINISVNNDVDNNFILNNTKVIDNINNEDSIDSDDNIVYVNIDKREDNIVNNQIFDSNNDNSFVTYKICIVRENDTIDTILEKYNTTLDILRKYNVINDIKVGDKIIIPYEKNK